MILLWLLRGNDSVYVNENLPLYNKVRREWFNVCVCVYIYSEEKHKDYEESWEDICTDAKIVFCHKYANICLPIEIYWKKC